MTTTYIIERDLRGEYVDKLAVDVSHRGVMLYRAFEFRDGDDDGSVAMLDIPLPNAEAVLVDALARVRAVLADAGGVL